MININDDFNFVSFGNEIIKVAKINIHRDIEFKNISENFPDVGLDSLDSVVFCIHAFEVFGVPQELYNNLNPKNLEELKKCLIDNGTISYQSDKDAIASIEE